MGSFEFDGLTIDKFDGTDFDYWKMQIKDLLYIMDQKFHLPLKGKPEDMKEEDWKCLDRKVLGIIRSTLSNNVVHHVLNETTTVGLMKTLADIYEKPYANKFYLCTELFKLKMADGVPFVEHLSKFNRIMNKLFSLKVEFDDELKAMILLSSLPESWEVMKVTTTYSLGSGKLKMEDIVDAAFAEEIRRRDFGATISSFKVEGRGKSIDNEPLKGRGKGKKDIECFYCHKKGHIKAKCRVLKRATPR